MKKHIYSLLFAFALIAGCTKNDSSIPKSVVLERVPEPQIVKNGGSLAIDMTNLASFEGKFDVVGVYFPSDALPAKYDVVIRKNDSSTLVKLFKADIATFPTSLTITAAQLTSLFGVPIKLGDNYDIGLDVYTKSGKKFEAFPPVGAGYGSGIANQPGASTSIRYTAICAYSPTLFAPIGGTATFQVLVDEWGDDPVNGWGPPAGYRPTVVITVVDATHLSFKSPVDGTSVIVLTVDPLTNLITYSGQPYGDLKKGPLQVDPGYPYGPATLKNLGPNFVAPCDLKINLAITYNVGAGQFRFDDSRGYFLILQKI